MQTALYGHLIDSDLAQIMRETPAALTQRFTTDFGFIREALTRLSTVFLRDIATGLALLGVMFWIDWQVTLLAHPRSADRRSGHRQDRPQAAPDGTVHAGADRH